MRRSVGPGSPPPPAAGRGRSFWCSRRSSRRASRSGQVHRVPLEVLGAAVLRAVTCHARQGRARVRCIGVSVWACACVSAHASYVGDLLCRARSCARRTRRAAWVVAPAIRSDHSAFGLITVGARGRLGGRVGGHGSGAKGLAATGRGCGASGAYGRGWWGATDGGRGGLLLPASWETRSVEVGESR